MRNKKYLKSALIRPEGSLAEDVTDSLRLGFNLAGLLLQFGASEPTGQETGSEYAETGPEQGDKVHTILKRIGEYSCETVKRGYTPVKQSGSHHPTLEVQVAAPRAF
jgi:hypothetical protein